MTNKTENQSNYWATDGKSYFSPSGEYPDLEGLIALEGLRAKGVKEKALDVLYQGGSVEFRNNNNSRLYIADGCKGGILGPRVRLWSTLSGLATFPFLSDVLRDHFIPSKQFEVGTKPANKTEYKLTIYQKAEVGYVEFMEEVEEIVEAHVGISSIQTLNIKIEDDHFIAEVTGETSIQ